MYFALIKLFAAIQNKSPTSSIFTRQGRLLRAGLLEERHGNPVPLISRSFLLEQVEEENPKVRGQSRFCLGKNSQL